MSVLLQQAFKDFGTNPYSNYAKTHAFLSVYVHCFHDSYLSKVGDNTVMSTESWENQLSVDDINQWWFYSGSMPLIG